MRTDTADRTREAGRATRGAPRTGRRPGPGASADRGQSTLDFGLGASLFLLALIGVLVFVSGTMQPFNEGSRENIGVADRVADSLSEGLLAEAGTPHVLNATCTVEFFDDNSPSYCRHSGTNLTERVGVKHWKLVNVTMQANVTGGPEEETLCWHSAGERVVEQASSDCDVAFKSGPQTPGSAADTVTARRVVTINGTDTTMRVEVW
jgi:hypothetical protein